MNKMDKELETSNSIPDYIFAIPKGGLTLGVRIFHEIEERNKNCRFIHDFKYFSDMEEAMLGESLKDKKIWIIDDVSDSGKTLLKTISAIEKFFSLENIKVITLYKKEGTRVNPDICPFETKRDVWIVFPWEKQEGKDEKSDFEQNI